ncbi:hypothetical protein B296_00014906 [Ensete ventricosum]|uniref:Uncharacterized protein n=1 Tax=Ensete ventricosum TaxID=4639 RepID=A0A426YB26_ENSVE|nr:hypothetical protein B296_00014906 [Ensete ventricosum]
MLLARHSFFHRFRPCANFVVDSCSSTITTSASATDGNNEISTDLPASSKPFLQSRAAGIICSFSVKLQPPDNFSQRALIRLRQPWHPLFCRNKSPAKSPIPTASPVSSLANAPAHWHQRSPAYKHSCKRGARECSRSRVGPGVQPTTRFYSPSPLYRCCSFARYPFPSVFLCFLSQHIDTVDSKKSLSSALPPQHIDTVAALPLLPDAIATSYFSIPNDHGVLSLLHEAVFLVLHRCRINLDEQRHFRDRVPSSTTVHSYAACSLLMALSTVHQQWFKLPENLTQYQIQPTNYGYTKTGSFSKQFKLLLPNPSLHLCHPVPLLQRLGPTYKLH